MHIRPLFLLTTCAKTHLIASVISNIFPRVIPRAPGPPLEGVGLNWKEEGEGMEGRKGENREWRDGKKKWEEIGLKDSGRGYVEGMDGWSPMAFGTS
jgi:hypothetical protein